MSYRDKKNKRRQRDGRGGGGFSSARTTNGEEVRGGRSPFLRPLLYVFFVGLAAAS